MMQIIIILAIIGLFISLYTYWVEQKIKRDSAYKPVCDLSDRVSCSKPMLSPYSNIFFFSNALIGTTYYIAVIFLSYFNMVKILFIIALGACVMSAGLAYLLYFKIKSLCLLCTSLYIINVLIFGLLLHNFQT